MRAALAWLFCAVAAAQEPVELTIAGPEAAQSFLRPTVDELIAPLGTVVWHDRLDALDLRAVVFPPASPAAALARIWIERGSDRVTIFLVDPEWERILVRHVPAPDGLDEAVREQVGQIVRAAIEALLGGARLGLTRDEVAQTLHVEPPPVVPIAPAAPPPPPPVTAPSLPQAGLLATGDAFLGYQGQLFADGPAVRSAIALALALRLGDGPIRPILVLGVDFWPTSSSEAAGVRLDLRTWVLRAELGADVQILPETSLRLTAGMALDITAVEPRMLGGEARIADAWDALAPLITMRAGLVQRVWEWLGLMGALVLDIDPIDARYVVATSSGDATVIDPWIVRPSLWLGAGALWR